MNNQAVVKFLAEQVMGWVYDEKLDGWLGVDEFAPVYFDPVNDIKDAWMVVEWMVANGYCVDTLSPYRVLNKVYEWTVQIEFILTEKTSEAEASTIQEAICIAAVKALADDEQLKEMGL
ncbi:hypothetical protein LCGC14_2167760 [marine sediment metagenome]|uniref:Phage ABA sandwich domain-containing protein n=1 Tax=marine sediment metagenome TaxID=412755 RepID=A0A0F9ED48_9ZZZZ